jgi:hypothetical protein
MFLSRQTFQLLVEALRLKLRDERVSCDVLWSQRRATNFYFLFNFKGLMMPASARPLKEQMPGTSAS